MSTVVITYITIIFTTAMTILHFIIFTVFGTLQAIFINHCISNSWDYIFLSRSHSDILLFSNVMKKHYFYTSLKSAIEPIILSH